MQKTVVALALTFFISVLLIPVAISLSWRMGAVDVPRDWRRMHRRCIPRNGGMAFFPALLIGCLLFCPRSVVLMPALKGALLLFAVGIADDIFDLAAPVKFGVQCFAALLAVRAVGLNWFYGLLAVLWILALTNAHNFVDGLDGLLGGTAVTEGVALGSLLLLCGQHAAALPAFLISAACAGFLLFNRPPAKIFSGDCGSGSIGFLFGVLSLPAFSCSQWSIGILAPLFVFAYPLTDLLTAVLRRVLCGKSPFAADRAHLHHRICATGVPQWLCTVILLSLSVMLGVLGVLLGSRSGSLWAEIVIAILVLLMASIRRFLLYFAQNS